MFGTAGSTKGLTEGRKHSNCYSYQLDHVGSNLSRWSIQDVFYLLKIGGKAYAVGRGGTFGSHHEEVTVEAFTPGNVWQIRNEMRLSSPTTHHCSVAIESHIITIGGNVTGTSNSNHVLQFNLEYPGHGWTRLESTTTSWVHRGDLPGLAGNLRHRRQQQGSQPS